jgi:hypothetical protein
VKIPVWILSTFLTAALLLQGWTLNEIVNLKMSVAAIQSQLTHTVLAKNEH